MAHYYTNDEVKSDPTSFDFKFKDHTIHFHSDAGVFSKNFIDYGSQALIRNIELSPGMKVLDVGCGYGAMGISLAVVESIEITMVDVNLRALDLCRKNCEVNHIEKAYVFESDAYTNVEGKFNVILTNPPIRAGKEVVNRILDGSYEHLEISGKFYVVIQKKQGAPSAKKRMEELFGNCEVLDRDKGYYILMSEKKN